MKAGVDVYLSRGTADALKLTSHRAHIIRALQQIQIGSWTILPFEAEHDAAEPLGFLLANQSGDKLLYATDTYYIRYRFKGLTHLMIECNYAADILQANVDKGALPPTMKRRIMRSHLSLEKLKGFLRANNLSKVKEIRLIHLSDGNSDAVRFKREIQELTGKPVIIEDKKAGL